jgi:hypothetical protein
MSCSSALPSARQKSVFAYPKQRATVLVGSVLKWRARPQCLRRQKSVFAYPKQRATVSVGSVLKWRARPQCLRRRRDFVLQMNNTWVSWPPKSWFWTKFSFRQNSISRVPKLPESTRRKQAIPNKGSLFYSHCGTYRSSVSMYVKRRSWYRNRYSNTIIEERIPPRIAAPGHQLLY